MLKLAIVDDKNSDIDKLEAMISEWKAISNCETTVLHYNHADEFLNDVQNNVIAVDGVFIDIQMPDGCGMDLAKVLHKEHPQLLKVFYSTLIEYTCEGFTVNAVRYLLKNAYDLREQTFECLDRLNRLVQDSTLEYTFGNQESIITIKVANILYVNAKGNYIIIHTKELEQRDRKTFKQICSELPDYFVVCNRSTIINSRKIRSLKANIVTLQDGSQIKVSDKCRDAIAHSLCEITSC